MLKLIKVLGMEYQTPTSKTKRRMCIVECSGCEQEHKIVHQQYLAGYTNHCLECSHKHKGK